MSVDSEQSNSMPMPSYSGELYTSATINVSNARVLNQRSLTPLRRTYYQQLTRDALDGESASKNTLGLQEEYIDAMTEVNGTTMYAMEQTERIGAHFEPLQIAHAATSALMGSEVLVQLAVLDEEFTDALRHRRETLSVPRRIGATLLQPMIDTPQTILLAGAHPATDAGGRLHAEEKARRRSVDTRIDDIYATELDKPSDMAANDGLRDEMNDFFDAQSRALTDVSTSVLETFALWEDANAYRIGKHMVTLLGRASSGQ